MSQDSMAEKAEGNESESEGKERQGERYRASEATERETK
jgi:hypothetical protein